MLLLLLVLCCTAATGGNVNCPRVFDLFSMNANDTEGIQGKKAPARFISLVQPDKTNSLIHPWINSQNGELLLRWWDSLSWFALFKVPSKLRIKLLWTVEIIWRIWHLLYAELKTSIHKPTFQCTICWVQTEHTCTWNMERWKLTGQQNSERLIIKLYQK